MLGYTIKNYLNMQFLNQKFGFGTCDIEEILITLFYFRVDNLIIKFNFFLSCIINFLRAFYITETELKLEQSSWQSRASVVAAS